MDPQADAEHSSEGRGGSSLGERVSDGADPRVGGNNRNTDLQLISDVNLAFPFAFYAWGGNQNAKKGRR